MQKMRLIGWLFLGAAAIFLGRGQSHAAPRANVELVYFVAIPLDSGVKLQWSTATELETAGFKIWRNQHGAYADSAALIDGNSSSRRADTATRPAVAGAARQVLALAQDEPTVVNGYPGSTGTPPDATEAYPAAQPSPLPADTVTPYPAVPAGAESSPPPVSIIGDETEAANASQPAANGQPINTRQALRGRLFLWGGFIVALLLFVTGVAGSIVLFMRRRS